ncbi:MAG: carbonic anhydrase family protein [Gammaproteobacteria bacterium]|nr:carbonic anhydrase family protein [Gammaproteobacteria bacterium]MBV8403142.1 carbonic anhydrase family protein [Gammaproteobacteria bacterium]
MTSRSVHFFAAAASVAALLAASAPLPAQEHAAHWTYSGANGPDHWGAQDPAFATCSSGHRQSPIDIESSTAAALPPIEFSYRAFPLTVTDTHHTFQVNVPAGSGGIAVGGDHYELVQFHFHHPSEERIHGKHYAMVAHLVHKNDKGELAVVAVLIHQGAANGHLNPIFDNFPAEGSENKVAGSNFDPMELLPAKHGYYTFEGSLTTPPCTEHVRWFVLKEPIQASAGQVGQFATRYPHNARPTQALNARNVEDTRD